MQQAKTLILSNSKDNSFKAIVNLKNMGASNIKFFSNTSLPKNLALGIKQDKKVVKIPLAVDGNSGNFDIKDIDLSSKILCAVVDISNPFCPEILLSGSQNSSQTNSHIESVFVQAKPDDASTLYEIESQDNIEEIIDKNLKDDAETTYFDACAKCKYREAFYKEGGSMCYKKLQQKDDEKLEKENNNCTTQSMENKIVSSDDFEKNNLEQPIEEQESFYMQVKPQIDALFNKYEPCEELASIISHSKWIKVVYDKDNNFYVLGLVFDEQGEVLYICYGMPAKDSATPPEDLEEYAGFIPKNIAYPDKEGYFIVCQDAKTGKTLKIDLI